MNRSFEIFIGFWSHSHTVPLFEQKSSVHYFYKSECTTYREGGGAYYIYGFQLASKSNCTRSCAVLIHAQTTKRRAIILPRSVGQYKHASWRWWRFSTHVQLRKHYRQRDATMKKVGRRRVWTPRILECVRTALERRHRCSTLRHARTTHDATLIEPFAENLEYGFISKVDSHSYDLPLL